MPNAADFYPGGQPHPPAALRRRIGLELGVLVLLTTLYVVFVPPHPPLLDIGLALVGMGMVGLLAKETSEQIWGPPEAPRFERVRRSTTQMLAITLPVIVVLLLFGAGQAYWTHREQSAWEIVKAVVYRLFRPTFFAGLVFYVLWALLQQVLFQFYLLGRLRALLPYASPFMLAFFNGVLYGFVHFGGSDPYLPYLAMGGGVLWSYSYYRDRYLIPIALSHAALASAYFYWGRDHDIIMRLVGMGPG